MPLIRSHLYVPADNHRLMAGAESRGADAIILDLEDSVAAGAKAAALDNVLGMLSSPPTGVQRWVRVNAGELGLSEIEAMLEASAPEGVWLPKIEPGPWTDTAIALLVEGGCRIGLLVETARGLVGMPQLPDIPQDSLAQLGEIDLRADLRIRDSSDEAMVPYRARIVMETAIRGLAAAVAPVEPDFNDLEAFRSSTVSLRDRGFSSRACIHPGQVSVANDVFSPTAEELTEARRVIAEFDSHAESGTGAFGTADGTMADLATVRWARDLVDSVRAE